MLVILRTTSSLSQGSLEDAVLGSKWSPGGKEGGAEIENAYRRDKARASSVVTREVRGKKQSQYGIPLFPSRMRMDTGIWILQWLHGESKRPQLEGSLLSLTVWVFCLSLAPCQQERWSSVLWWSKGKATAAGARRVTCPVTCLSPRAHVCV